MTLTYNGGTLVSASVVASATGATTASATLTPTPTFYEFSIPVGTNKPQWIAAGADGNMWFTESPGNAVARITPAGVVTEFPVSTAASNPQGIIGASDHRLWFTEFAGSKIGALTTTGTFTEFATLFANDGPQLLVDRARLQPLLHRERRAASTRSDGSRTLRNDHRNLADRRNPSVADRARARRKLWFTENGTNQIGRLSPNSFSVASEFPTLTLSSQPTGITVRADGALWFTETGLDKIGRITTGGVVSEYSSPVTGLALQGIAAAPDGSLWASAPGSGSNPGRIARLVY